MTGRTIMCSLWILLCQHLSLQSQPQPQQQWSTITLFYEFFGHWKKCVRLLCGLTNFFGMHTTFHAAKFKTLFYCQWNDERKTGKKVEKFLLSFIWRILFGHGNHVHWIIFVYWNFWIITVITCLSESQFACVWLNAARVIIH